MSFENFKAIPITKDARITREKLNHDSSVMKILSKSCLSRTNEKSEKAATSEAYMTGFRLSIIVQKFNN